MTLHRRLPLPVPLRAPRTACDEAIPPSGGGAYQDAAPAAQPTLPPPGQGTVLQGDCLEVLATLPDACADAVVTDPPYGLEFGGREWDAPWKYGFAAFGFKDGKGRRPAPTFGGSRNPVCRRCHRQKRGANRCVCEAPDFDEAEHRLRDMLTFAAWCEAWASECLRVLKPGGHLLAFGGSRTHHWLAAGIESAGFEIRDCIAWLKFGGFPKSTDLGKHFDRRAGAERPVLSVRRTSDIRGGNYLKKPGAEVRHTQHATTEPVTEEARRWTGWGNATKPMWEPVIVARKPLRGTLIDNVARYGTGALNIDGCRVPWSAGEAMAAFGGHNVGSRPGGEIYAGKWGQDRPSTRHPLGRHPANAATLEPDAYWSPYCLVVPPSVAKKSGAERDTFNDHATVKPVPLMRWLCRLVTPPGGLVLDPFAGSGSTGVAAAAEGFAAVLIERDPHFADVARRRVAAVPGAGAGGPMRAGAGADGRDHGARPISLFESAPPP